MVRELFISCANCVKTSQCDLGHRVRRRNPLHNAMQFGDGNTGANHASDQAANRDFDRSFGFGLAGQRCPAIQGQGLYRPTDGLGSSSSVPDQLLTGTSDRREAPASQTPGFLLLVRSVVNWTGRPARACCLASSAGGGGAGLHLPISATGWTTPWTFSNQIGGS